MGNLSPVCQDASNVMPESQLARLKVSHVNCVYEARVTCIMYMNTRLNSHLGLNQPG